MSNDQWVSNDHPPGEMLLCGLTPELTARSEATFWGVPEFWGGQKLRDRGLLYIFGLVRSYFAVLTTTPLVRCWLRVVVGHSRGGVPRSTLKLGCHLGPRLHPHCGRRPHNFSAIPLCAIPFQKMNSTRFGPLVSFCLHT